MDPIIGPLGAVGGIIVAVLIFASAWWFVRRAREGNRRVREARGDPHTDVDPRHGERQDPRRDISQ